MKQKTITLIEKIKTLQKSMYVLALALEVDYPDKALEITGAAQIMDSWVTGMKNEK